MGWYDDFGAGTYQTKSGNVLAGMNRYYDRKFLSVPKNVLRLIPFGQRRPLPMGEGKTIEFYRWNAINPSVSAATLTEGVNPNATLLTGQSLTATIGEYGAFAQISSLMAKTHIDGKLSTGIGSIAELFGEHAATIMDTLANMEVASNAAMPLRADFATDTGATYTGTITGVTSTTVFADSALETNTDYGDANDDLNQSLLTFITGKAKGQQRAVTDYALSGGAITVSPALDVEPAVGDTFVVTSPDGIASGDKLTYANIKRAVRKLKEFKAPKFGGHYIGIIDPEAAEGLMDDSDWKAVHTYKDQTTGIFEGEIGKVLGVRMIEHTNAFSFPIAARGTAGSSYGPGAGGANYSTASTAHVSANYILGREAFGVTTFKNRMGQIGKPPMIIKTSGSNDTSNPLNRYGTAGWQMDAVYKGLQPLFGQQIWTYRE